MLTQNDLKKTLHYGQQTGVFTRIIGTRRKKSGAVCGDVKSSGYRYIGVCRTRHRAHRLAFLYMLGRWPTEQVDHIDGNRDNNAWSNLREATNADNGRNLKLNKKNSSGVCGVSWLPNRKKWRARIMINGRERHIGLFESIASAAAARNAAQARYGFHPNHGRARHGYQDV